MLFDFVILKLNTFIKVSLILIRVKTLYKDSDPDTKIISYLEIKTSFREGHE